MRAQRGDGARERAHAGEARGVVPDLRVEKADVAALILTDRRCPWPSTATSSWPGESGGGPVTVVVPSVGR